MVTKLDLFMAEVKAYDYQWFCEIGGQDALAEIGRLREQVSNLTQDAPDLAKAAQKDGPIRIQHVHGNTFREIDSPSG